VLAVPSLRQLLGMCELVAQDSGLCIHRGTEVLQRRVGNRRVSCAIGRSEATSRGGSDEVPLSEVPEEAPL